MQYNNIGNSGLKVSRLGLGCMSFGDNQRGSHSWTLDERESREILLKAFDLGINYFDTANIYSLGSSEEILGNIINKYLLREDIVISTKVYEKITDSPLSGGLSRKELFYQIDQSLKRLKTDYIDLYVIHRWDPYTPIEETMEALNDLIKLGKVRYIGASSMRAWQFIKAQYVSKMNGWSQFISMQSHYNLISREEEREMIPFCESEGFGFTPWSPLARGKLASNNIMEENTSRKESDKVQKWLYDESSSNDRTIISTLQKISTEKGLSSAQVSLAWLLSKKVVSAPIIGCTTVRQLVDNVKSVELSLSPADIVELESSYLPHNTPELS